MAGGYPLQDSCLENSKDRGAWWAGYSPWGRQDPNTTQRLSLSHTGGFFKKEMAKAATSDKGHREV